MTAGSLIEEVEELRFEAEFLLEDKDALVFEHVADLGGGIIEIPKDARAGGTCLQTGWQAAIPRAVQAEGAFLHHALRTDAVAEVALVWINLCGGDLRLLPVEAAGVIRTRGLAVAAADAPVVIHDDDSVFFLPGGLDRADIDAGRMLALLALHGHVVFVRLRDGMVVVDVAFLEVHRAFRHLKDADVALVRGAVMIVLQMACLGAFAAAVADGKIERVAKFYAFLRLWVADGHIGSVLFFGLLGEAGDDGGDFVFAELLVVLLQELIHRGFIGQLGERRERFRIRGDAECGSESLQHGAAGGAVIAGRRRCAGRTAGAGAIAATGCLGRCRCGIVHGSMLCGDFGNGNAVAWRQHGPHEGKFRMMRVVAVDAVVPHAGALGQIPVAVHAAVAAVEVITHRRAVALGAERHHIGKGHAAAIGEVERVVVFRVVTTEAG